MLTKEEIKSILANILDSSIDDITDDIPLVSLGYDSLKFVNTIVAIESQCNIEFYDSDLLLDNFKDVLSIYQITRKYFAQDTKLYKCIITDCDGVLWRGIAGESGDDRAFVDEKTQKVCALLRNCREHGLLLANCSKNEYSNVDAMLGYTSIDTDDFAIIETNVIDKAESVLHILDAFGYAANNAIYIDDSDAELDYLKIKIPELTVIKADYTTDFSQKLSATLSPMFRFEAIDRTSKYREQKLRESIHVRVASPDEYNQILKTQKKCQKAQLSDVSRLAELSQRANRFNLTGARYTEEELKSMMCSNKYSIYKLCAQDKFGDMGLVAMAIIQGGVIESFILSCRVFGRGFEFDLLNRIQSDYSADLRGIYISTGKNDYCKYFYRNRGVEYELR